MLRPRIIPCLLLRGMGLVKGIRFRDHTYVGDPINAVQIFNTKEVDELFFLDIAATREGRIPPVDLVQRIADQCLMPFAVGGGISRVEDARRVLAAGAEKVCMNTAALETPLVIRQMADSLGSQSVVVSLDYRRGGPGGISVMTRCATQAVSNDLVASARQVEASGAGEILLNSIDRDGTREGFDLEAIRSVSEAVSIPVIACGGAGSNDHLRQALKDGRADAVAAGSFFVHHGRRRAVLISFPTAAEVESIIG